ncbi:hypothetical protein [Halomonas aquatica]|uniref:Pyruvate carboxyltransferase domain-containing protein n=1 Tax=Halomonas aquatica TaxID=3151123 RepID=A0ABV1NF65_9GAMM
MTSFVSPRAVPALADARELMSSLRDTPDVHFFALVPNLRVAERALEAGVDSVVLFVSASQTHNAKNVNCRVEDSLAGFEQIARHLEGSGIEVRGAMTTAFGCPFEGDIDVQVIGRIASHFADLGANRLSLGHGVLGYSLRKLEIPTVPVVLGLLGGQMEFNLRRAMAISAGEWNILWSSGISMGIYLFAVTLIVAGLVYSWVVRARLS